MSGAAEPEIVAFLSQPASYGEPSATVDRLDTHASLIFLVGARAFKMKRAVSFSYLDYSTLALRKRYCEAELELGRRLAPTLYRRLHAVTRERDGGLALDGAGEPVEWLLEMRRFDQSALFDRLAESNRLTPNLMRELADEIAAFHGSAEVALDRGGSAAIHALIQDIEANLSLAGKLLDAGTVRALGDAQASAFKRLVPLLDRRRAGGKVRRCHGDLHLRNICLVDGKPTLFDPIEFSDDLATIDVLYDLAFLLMDLHYRGHDELGNRVLNRYLDRTEDQGGLAALPLFLSLRAGIRAHVTAAAASGPSQAEATANLAKEARAYLALATELLRPQAPRLVAIGGLSGSGKTSLAHALAPALGPVPGARVLRSDVLRKQYFGVSPETRLPALAYERAATEQVYRSLCEQAAETLAGGYAVLADAVFLRPDERHAIGEVARAKGVRFTGLWLEAAPDRLARRIQSREHDASDATVAVMRRQAALDPGPITWHPIDAGGEIERTTEQARSILVADAT
ncbi:MAG TPA: AAA family ATPase [Stellaceae bacterium]|nr:AAA family ATPase [Stellaceae bacterium]